MHVCVMNSTSEMNDLHIAPSDWLGYIPLYGDQTVYSYVHDYMSIHVYMKQCTCCLVVWALFAWSIRGVIRQDYYRSINSNP